MTGNATSWMLGHMSGWMWWGMGAMVLFWVALIAFGVWAVRRFADRPSGAYRVLEERFARGEIDAEEFEKRRKLIER
jgi:putative membrane protein